MENDVGEILFAVWRGELIRIEKTFRRGQAKGGEGVKGYGDVQMQVTQTEAKLKELTVSAPWYNV